LEHLDDKVIEEIINEIIVETINDHMFEGIGDAKILFGQLKKKLRRVGGSLKIVKKNKKPLPMSLRNISRAAAKRRARKSSISRKGKQKRVTKKAMRTTKKGRAMGLYKK